MRNPKVTVLMPVYNGEKYLREAIDSILNQTYSDFKFLIIDDGSTDKSKNIIKSYNDSRINLYVNETNLGLAKTLNKGIDLINTEYIARMDCDDISLPNRLQKQVEFMDSHPNVGICGTWAKVIMGHKERIMKPPISYEDIKAFLLFGCIMVHVSVMMRISMLKDYNLYYSTERNFDTVEDYELWQRCSMYFPIRNIPEVLLIFRIHPKSTRVRNTEIHTENIRNIHENNLKRLNMNINIDTILSYRFGKDKNMIEKTHRELIKLLEYNKNMRLYSEKSLKKIINDRWFTICYNSAILGFWIWKKYWGSPLKKNIFNLDIKRMSKFTIKCLLKI